jgi:hypothetical protein
MPFADIIPCMGDTRAQTLVAGVHPRFIRENSGVKKRKIDVRTFSTPFLPKMDEMAKKKF